MNRLLLGIALLLGASALLITGCETEPTPATPESRDVLHKDMDASLAKMKSQDPGLNDLLNRSYGYAIFPSVGKGGLIVGGAYGRGEVYEQGRLIGYAELQQGSVGLQAGGQEYSELIVFETQEALRKFTGGQFSFTADASAIALKAGASADARFRDGIAVFTMPKSGLMFEASIGGQNFNYQPVSDQDRERLDRTDQMD